MKADELRALADAATPGPWFETGWDDSDRSHWIGGGGEPGSMRERGVAGTFVLPLETDESPQPKANAALIAALGPDAARLLADAMDMLSDPAWPAMKASREALLARFAALGGAA